MNIIARSVEYYESPNGRTPYIEWFDSLKSGSGKNIVRTRLARLRAGNFGDCKPVGEGVFELRVHAGPGYRVYFGQAGTTVVLLLIGGDKSTQHKDIPVAQAYWLEYRRSRS